MALTGVPFDRVELAELSEANAHPPGRLVSVVDRNGALYQSTGAGWVALADMGREAGMDPIPPELPLGAPSVDGLALEQHDADETSHPYLLGLIAGLSSAPGPPGPPGQDSTVPGPEGPPGPTPDLSGYSPVTHDHDADYAGAAHDHPGYATTAHGHTAADVGAAPVGHTHPPPDLSGYSPTSHTHPPPVLTDADIPDSIARDSEVAAAYVTKGSTASPATPAALTGTLGTTGTALVALATTYSSTVATNANNNYRRLMDAVNALRTEVEAIRSALVARGIFTS